MSQQFSGDRSVASFGEETAGLMLVTGSIHHPEHLGGRSPVGEGVAVGGDYVGGDPSLGAKHRRDEEAFVLDAAHRQPVPQGGDPVGELGDRDPIRWHEFVHVLVQPISDDCILAGFHG